jgi:hypothetical protein
MHDGVNIGGRFETLWFHRNEKLNSLEGREAKSSATFSFKGNFSNSNQSYKDNSTHNWTSKSLHTDRVEYMLLKDNLSSLDKTSEH